MTPQLERVRALENANLALAIAQENQLAARTAIVEIDFADRQDGTNTVLLEDGRKLKCVVEHDYSTDADRVKLCIEKLTAAVEDGAFIAARLFKFKPDVSVGELKKLSPKLRKIADRAIDAKPKRPTVKIVEA